MLWKIQSFVRKSIVHENTTADEMKEIIEAVKNSAAIDKAFAFSERYLHKALEMIKPLHVDKRSMHYKM